MKKLIIPVMLLMAMSLVFMTSCKDKKESEAEVVEEVEMEMEAADEKPTMEAVHQGDHKLPTVNVTANQRVSSPLQVRLNSQGLWMGYEGEVGVAKLLDASGNQLAMGILKAEGEWMKSGPVMYATTLEFDATGHSSGTLVLEQNAGPGEGDEAGESASFSVPVKF
jgi:hypothetical protein